MRDYLRREATAKVEWEDNSEPRGKAGWISRRTSRTRQRCGQGSGKKNGG